MIVFQLIDFSKFRKLERNNWRHIPGLIRTLVENIESTIDLITRTNLTAKVLTVKSQISLSNLVDQIRVLAFLSI